MAIEELRASIALLELSVQHHKDIATRWEKEANADLERIVQLEAALLDCADWIGSFAAGASKPPKDGREVLRVARSLLAPRDPEGGSSGDEPV